ncbi:MAG: Undecaprenyl-phosphate 4-deoxy-4-formamido-L-arabinose transferase [Planctomycetes bacterium ADurb.Bin412]|nr:MAG: Undecaprenyl-phosphate 4-deoxy-4-formamido-L-arabinose transferase [Planctomycetes bacterium ADurb.Bin412]
MKKSVMEAIGQFRTPHPIVALLALRVTEKIGSIQVDHQERPNGQSSYTLKILFRQFMHGLIYHSDLPLKCLRWAGIGSIGLGLGAGLFCCLRSESDLPAKTGGPAVLILLPLFSGILILCLWIVAEYLHRILEGLYQGPAYLIGEKEV